ncbi:unnamed protein product [Prorocentrum cordatum]|uniref:Uncharacterized protein n=1 Tax=Prorocentrum cordatum TaxID=2364126 RepID=A0ABN9WFK9_9DINO|nr:unnamed protein product [Polarella glacialis]
MLKLGRAAPGRVTPPRQRLELHFPPALRAGRLAASCAATAPLLALAFAAGIAFLNLQGNVHPPTQEEGKRGFAWYSSWFYLPRLAGLSAPGARFDASGPAGCVPYALQILVMKALNGAYSALAVRLTTWENHRTGRG